MLTGVMKQVFNEMFDMFVLHMCFQVSYLIHMFSVWLKKKKKKCFIDVCHILFKLK